MEGDTKQLPYPPYPTLIETVFADSYCVASPWHSHLKPEQDASIRHHTVKLNDAAYRHHIAPVRVLYPTDHCPEDKSTESPLGRPCRRASEPT